MSDLYLDYETTRTHFLALKNEATEVRTQAATPPALDDLMLGTGLTDSAARINKALLRLQERNATIAARLEALAEEGVVHMNGVENAELGNAAALSARGAGLEGNS